MRAIAHRGFGSPDRLELTSMSRPVPGDDDLLVRVCAAAVNKGDWHVLTGKPYPVRLAGYGLRRPRHPGFGQEFAGQVESVGRNVTAFQPGDAVFGSAVSGAFAEFVRVPQSRVAPMPPGMDFEAAAALPSSGITALQALRDVARIQPGQAVLVIGASGGVGTFAVQLAKHFGAEVSGVCSTPNVDLVHSLGAHRVIDYHREDFADGGPTFDLVLDLAGNRSLADCLRVLRPGGTYVACSGAGGDWLGPFPRFLRMSLLSRIRPQRLTWFIAEPKREDLDFLAERVVAGDLVPAISRRWKLEEVPEALALSGSGRTRGKMIIFPDR